MNKGTCVACLMSSRTGHIQSFLPTVSSDDELAEMSCKDKAIV